MSETEEHLPALVPGEEVHDDPAPLMLAAPEVVNNNPNGLRMKYHVAVNDTRVTGTSSADKGAIAPVHVQVFANSDAAALEEARQIWLARHGMAATSKTEFTVAHVMRPGYVTAPRVV